MMSNEPWGAVVIGNEDASNKTIVAALHKYIVKHCKNQQYQMSDVTWRNFCLKVADSLRDDDNNDDYNCNKIINYICNNNDCNRTINNTTVDNNNTTVDNNNTTVDNNNTSNNIHGKNSFSYNINDYNKNTNNTTNSINTTSPNTNNDTSNNTQVWIHHLKYFLSRYQHIFSSTELCTQEPSYLVRSNVRLSLCKDYLSKEGCHKKDCRDLHCCKYFIYENCKFGDNCSYGHNLRGGRNKDVLESNYIFLEDEDDSSKKIINSKYHVNNTIATSNTTNNKNTTKSIATTSINKNNYNSNNTISQGNISTNSSNPSNNNSSNPSNNNSSNPSNNNSSNPSNNNSSNHNNSKLRKQIRYLAHYTIADLSLVLRHDYPRICRFYNTELGCKYGTDGKKCPGLHLCREVVMGDRCASDRCTLNHSVHSPQVSSLLCRQGFVVNEYSKESIIFAELKISEEVAENANNQPGNPNINQSINQSNSQSISSNPAAVYSLADPTMQHYDSPSHNLVSQANNLYDNRIKNPYDNHSNNNPYDNHSNNNPYNNQNNHHYDNQNNMPYDNALVSQMTYFGGEEMVDEEGGLYNEVYNNQDGLYNNLLYNNTEEVYDDRNPSIYYPNNYLSNNEKNNFYASSLSGKENKLFYQPAPTKENNNYFAPLPSSKQPPFNKVTAMTLRQQHLRQRKRIDNSSLRVCKYYNVERGCKFVAAPQQYCPNLHLCHHFVAGKCIYGGEKCRRSHKINDASVKWVLQSNNIDVSMMTESILEEIRRRLNMTDDSLSSESESEEDLREHAHLSSPFTTRSTLTPTACEFTPSKNTNISSPKTTNTPKNNQNSNNKNNTTPMKNTSLKLRSTKINTFVFLDLEATGFHQSKITELSLVAVHRSSIEEAVSSGISVKAQFLPRIINKLTICVNPGKPIEKRAAEITGMSSSMLDNQGGFSDHTADLIILFIHALEPPCCLVAHNGRGFDFPLLRHELFSINRHAPYDLYCIDSLVLFRSLNSSEKWTPRKAVEKMPTPSKALPITSPNGTPISISKPFEYEGGDEDLKAMKGTLSKHLSSSLDEVEGGKQERTDWWCCSDVEDNNLLNNGYHDSNKISPNKLSSSTSNLTLNAQTDAEKSKRKQRTDWWDSEEDDHDDEDEFRVQKKHNGIKSNGMKVNGIKANGHNGDATTQSIVQSKSSEDFLAVRVEEDDAKKTKKKLSYKLAEVHKRVTGEYPQRVHRAEDDSEALLRCFIFTPGALQWSDHNATPFTLPSNNS